MDVIKIEEDLALCSLCIIAKPCAQDLVDLRKQYNVTDNGNGTIQITYK